MLMSRRSRWPSSVPITRRMPPAVASGDVAVTFIGHSSFLIQTGTTALLIDPIYSERASPVTFAGPRRVRAPGVRFDDLPPISVVLVSHNHYDHCDLRTLATLNRRFQPSFLTPLANAPLLNSVGITRVTELDWWDSADVASIKLTATPAQHFSARGLFDRDRALWSGFFIEAAGRRILFAGDSGYGPHFRDIAARLAPIDLALLPIGAYEPRWFMKDIHMTPQEAVQAHLDLGAQQSIAMHFGTFQLTPEAVDEPVLLLSRALEEQGVSAAEFRTLEVGESVVTPALRSPARRTSQTSRSSRMPP